MIPWDISLSELGPPLVVAVLTYTTSKGFRFGKKKLKERGSHIDGEYIATFEEENRKSTAYTVLEQNGNSITGSSELSDPDRERTTELEGNLSEDGNHLYGQYCAEDQSDEFKGAFFLRAENDGTLQGFWTGYVSSTGRQMDSGRYTLTPVLNDISLSIAGENDDPGITQVAEDTIPDLDVEPLLGDVHSNDDCFCLVCREEAKNGLISPMRFSNITRSRDVERNIIGFAIFRLLESNELAVNFPLPESETPQVVGVSDKVGVVESICVTGEYQNRGLGSKLIVQCTDRLRNDGADIITAFTQSGGRLEWILRKHGFESSLTIKTSELESNQSVSKLFSNSGVVELLVKTVAEDE